MIGDGSVTLDWGGEERRFRLRIAQMRELQENINRPRIAIGGQPVGPKTFFQLLINGDAWPHEVREVIRLGLIGGGTPHDQVGGLMRRYFDERPFQDQASIIAAQVFGAGWAGPPEDPVGKKAEAEGTTSPSSSPPFTAAAPPSASVPDRLMN